MAAAQDGPHHVAVRGLDDPTALPMLNGRGFAHLAPAEIALLWALQPKGRNPSHLMAWVNMLGVYLAVKLDTKGGRKRNGEPYYIRETSLVDRLRLSPKTVRAALRRLCDAGLLIRAERTRLGVGYDLPYAGRNAIPGSPWAAVTGKSDSPVVTGKSDSPCNREVRLAGPITQTDLDKVPDHHHEQTSTKHPSETIQAEAAAPGGGGDFQSHKKQSQTTTHHTAAAGHGIDPPTAKEAKDRESLAAELTRIGYWPKDRRQIEAWVETGQVTGYQVLQAIADCGPINCARRLAARIQRDGIEALTCFQNRSVWDDPTPPKQDPEWDFERREALHKQLPEHVRRTVILEGGNLGVSDLEAMLQGIEDEREAKKKQSQSRAAVSGGRKPLEVHSWRPKDEGGRDRNGRLTESEQQRRKREQIAALRARA